MDIVMKTTRIDDLFVQLSTHRFNKMVLYLGSFLIPLIVENWKLKIKNWKHYSNFFLKCVNSTVRPSFKVFFCWIKYLQVPWIVHGTHWKSIILLKTDFSSYIAMGLTSKNVKRRHTQLSLQSKRILNWFVGSR